MTSTSTALWIEKDAEIKSSQTWVQISTEEIESTLWFPDHDRETTSESVSKIDELNAALLDVRKRLMGSLDSRTFAGVGSSS